MINNNIGEGIEKLGGVRELGKACEYAEACELGEVSVPDDAYLAGEAREGSDVREIKASIAARRADDFISESFNMTRSAAARLIKLGNVLVNGKGIKPSKAIEVGDSIKITLPPARLADIVPQDIPLDIVYEDNDLLVVNKPRGMVVHPSFGNESGTLVNALLGRRDCGDNGGLSTINGVVRPGIVHRIDKDTTGLLLVAKTDEAHVGLSRQIKAHSLTRGYKALVHGGISEPGVVNEPIGRSRTDRQKMCVTQVNSREAITHYNPIEKLGNYTLVECRLETGRTHQIRVHLSYISHPIVGDKTYGVRKEKWNLAGQLLHAYLLGFIHPITSEYMEFKADVPEDFAKVLKGLRG
ncbi:MAG: RluA family pseudouridine synthase [Clostridiales bacterium]|jgi:23S rRNA pseudouridine1911/1915/1917 synthase|nr:RluA family pseudouridine synthase [Clostridiales bacterium]